MFKIFLKSCFIIFFLTNFSLAEVIRNVEVFGNKRISKESIIVFGEIKYNLNYNDNDLNIKWPIKKPIISLKDKKNYSLKEFCNKANG